MCFYCSPEGVAGDTSLGPSKAPSQRRQSCHREKNGKHHSKYVVTVRGLSLHSLLNEPQWTFTSLLRKAGGSTPNESHDLHLSLCQLDICGLLFKPMFISKSITNKTVILHTVTCLLGGNASKTMCEINITFVNNTMQKAKPHPRNIARLKSTC